MVLQLELDGLKFVLLDRNLGHVTLFLEDMGDAFLGFGMQHFTIGNNARLALRIRVNMSEIGSVISKSFYAYQLAFVMPGINPFNAASRNVRREQLNLRI